MGSVCARKNGKRMRPFPFPYLQLRGRCVEWDVGPAFSKADDLKH